jgi:hypothetical protein
MFGAVTKIGNGLAQIEWLAASFGSRDIQVEMPLNLSMRPGMYVKVGIPVRKLQGKVFTETTYAYHGLVKSVEMSIDAGSTYASTVLHIQFAHTDEERKNAQKNGVDIGKHPLYISKWSPAKTFTDPARDIVSGTKPYSGSDQNVNQHGTGVSYT